MWTPILKTLYAESQVAKNRPVHKTLSRGLRVSLYYDHDHVVLTLSRARDYPSEKEWQTVLEHFAFPVRSNTQPEKLMADHRPSLRARLPVPKQVQLSFL